MNMMLFNIFFAFEYALPVNKSKLSHRRNIRDYKD